MPGKVKVKIISGRNLPVMDRSSDTTDAYVEIKLGTTTYKTDVCRKSLHPQWNSEWYRFELDDAELQDEPLQIRLMDHDTYSANDAIGKVYLDLNPLLLPATSLLGKWNDGGNSSHEGNNSVMSGWIPVYDTMHGIHGEVNVIVKVELFTDFNKFRQSSCGVQFFCSPAIPHGFYAQVIHGFVEELVVNDDPEYQWIDKIRTPRASNEARQTLFCKLSGELQRRIGLKALEMGGNAVIGYYQCFDLEGESGIVARGIGTAVTLMKLDLPPPSPANADSAANDERAQGYLKFLGSAKGFHLNNESKAINDNTLNAPQLHSVPLPSPTASFRSLKLENCVFRPEKMPQYLIRHLSSDREFNYPMPIGSEGKQHSVSLQTLLKQEDQRGRPGYGISQRFRNLRFTSQSMIIRKMSALKARLTTDENDADAKRPLMKYRRTQSDNTGMAEILVRSVFHATTSLDCIAESPKLGSDEESKDRSFLTLPVASKSQSSPASSLTSIESSDDDDDDDDDEDEDDEEEATGDTIGELDTVSHIVETVRKLSMIQSSIDSGELKYDDNKFLFVIGDAEDQPEVSFDADLEDANLLYYQDVDDEDAKELETESFLPQFVRAFELMRKSATATSLSAAVDLPPSEEKRPMNKKFTSLHNIHASESRWNKYSAHGGKETVLGELFQRIDSAHMLSESELSDYSLDRSHGSVGKSDDINILSDEKVSKQDSREDAVNGLKRTKPLKLIIESRGETSYVIGHKVDANTAEIKSKPSVDSKPDMKRKSKGFLTKKVLKVLHKLDDKIHHKKDKIFHETSPDTNKEHEKILPPKSITSGAQNALSTSSDDLEKERINKSCHVDSPTLSSSHLSEDISQHSSGSDEHKHGLLHKLKHAPMDLIHKLDTKIHEVGHHNEKGGIKNEHGLLNIALGNVLMDSVQEVLVTSHTASPNDCPPVFPIIQDETLRETIDLPHESSLISKDSHRKSEDFETLSKSEETDHKHGIFEKIKEGKDRILHSNIIHKIDNKIHNLGHHEDKSGIKHEHGLLNIALGNVLMDSVQEVLATSHSASPNANPPEFPALQSSDVPLNTSERPHPMLPQLGRLGSHSHVIGFDRRDSQYTPSASAIEEESVNQPESLQRHSLLDKFKENKEKLFLRIDSKDSVTSHSEPENDKIVTPELSPHTEKHRPMLRLFSRPEFIPQVIDLEGNEEKSSSELSLLKEHVDQQESPRRQSLLDKLKDGKDKLLHHPKDLFHKKGSKGHSDLGTFHSPTMSSAPGSPEQSQKTSEENITQTGKDKKHGILNLLKEGKHKLFHRPRELFYRLDSKIHDDKAGIKEEHGLINIALGNVLIDSVQEVLATSHSASPKSESESPQFFANTSERPHPKLPQLGRQGSHSHVLELKDGPEHFTPTEPEIIEDDELEFEQPSGVENLIKLDSPTSVTSHNLLGKLKEGKEKLLSGPKKLFHRLDSKMHEDKSSIKSEHGLINIALGNVLMDSVQEVLATSHSALPKSELETPEFPSNTSERSHPKLPQLGREGSHSHVLELKDGPELFTPCSEILEKLESLPGTSHNLLENLKGGKEKLLHDPKELFHRLDSKVHDTGSPGIKKEHGLLNIALSNVLMDSVHEVLATSHSETPTPEALSKLTLLPPQVPSQLDSNLSPPLNTSQASSNLLPLETIDPNNANSLVVGVNTEVDSGHHDCINTMHACLTTHRNVETPLPTPITTVVTTTTMITTTTTAATPIESGTRTENGHQRTESLGVRISHSPAKINAIPCIHRRSSDSDLSITPKGNSLTGSDRSGGYSSGQYMRGAMLRTTRPQENFDIMEYPFLTLSKYPAGFIAHIGGSVSARSVKLLERISNIEEPESRDTWWSEIRMEIRSHARALNCNAVLGYTESTSICDDVCVLSASGTAAVLCLQHHTTGEASDNVSGLPVLPKNNANTTTMTTSLDRNDFEKDKEKDKEKPKVEEKLPSNGGTGNNNSSKAKVVPVNGTTGNTNSSPEREAQNVKPSCSLSHLPYTSNSKPLRSSSIKCYTCGAHKVPDMLIATIEMPDGMPNFGRGCFIQSYVCRPLKDLKGESNAKEISDGLPFLEYELHRFLINKLKVKGMNAIFGLKVRISIGERMLIGIATGTAVFLSSLPPPLLPKLVSDRTTDEKKLTQLQKNLHDTIKKNREIYQLFAIEEVNGETSKLNSESDDSEEETATLDLAMGNKDCCVLEVDDPDDVDVLNSLMEPRPPDGFHVVNTEHVPGLEDLEIVKNLQMFTQIWRAKIPAPFNLDKHFHRLLQSVYFKLRRMIPCALCDLQFRVDSPEPDEIQLCVLGMALGLGDPFKGQKKRKIVIPKRNDDELIFNLEEDQIPENSVVQTPPTHLLQAQSLKYRQKSPVRNKLTKQRHVPYRERHGVDITPLSYVPGGKIEKYLGNLNFFLIRETTSLREEGGLSGFIHSFVTEILAIVRAHVTALGGNAMVAYFITECVLNHNLHKNQGQCLINVGGDVVYVSYFTEDH